MESESCVITNYDLSVLEPVVGIFLLSNLNFKDFD